MKWLIMGGYNPHKKSISYFLKHIGDQLDKHLQSYENLMLLGDFNSEMTENKMIDFCEMYNLQNLIKDPTCYKNPSNPSSIDVILTNKIEFCEFYGNRNRSFRSPQNDSNSLKKVLQKT